MKETSNETKEIIEAGRFTTKYSAERVVRLSIQKAVISVIGIVAISSLGSVWATLAVANTIPFRVSAIEKDVSDIKVGYESKDISNLKWTQNDLAHTAIEKKLDLIEVKIDDIRNRLK